MSEKIKCLECEQEFYIITCTHLKYRHGMDFKTHIEKHPDAKLFSESALKKIGISKNDFIKKKDTVDAKKYINLYKRRLDINYLIRRATEAGIKR